MGRALTIGVVWVIRLGSLYNSVLRDSIVSCFDADTKVAQHKAEIFEEQVPDKQLLRDADKLG